MEGEEAMDRAPVVVAEGEEEHRGEATQFEMARDEELKDHQWRERNPITSAPANKIYPREDRYWPAKLAPYFAGSAAIVTLCIVLAGWLSGDGRSKFNVDVSGIVASRIQLPDGRYIAYEERGVSRDAAKRNILVSHGFLSCRLAGIPGISDKLLEKYEARVVAYDRPGIGQSDPNPKQSFNSSAQDMAYIADALGMGEKFWLMGYSGGGPFAWAALHHIPHRLAGVFMFGPMGNPYASNMTKAEVKSIWRQVGLGKRTIYRIARHFPFLLPSFFKKVLMGKPVKIMRSVKKSAPPTDMALIEQDHFGHAWERSLRESMRSGDAMPHAQDYALFGSDWGFKLSDLGPKPVEKSLFKRMFSFLGGSNLAAFFGPIHIFHGTDDSLVPIAYSEYAKRVLPQVQLHILEGHGHFSWFCHCDSCHRELFKTLFGEVYGLDELDKVLEHEVEREREPLLVESRTSFVEPDVALKTKGVVSSEVDGGKLEETESVVSSKVDGGNLEETEVEERPKEEEL